MEPLKLSAPWSQVKEWLKEVDYHLTDEDLSYDPKEPSSLMNHLAKKLNRTPEEIRMWIESVSYNRGIAG